MLTTTEMAAPESYYQGLADELEILGEAVETHPHLAKHYAERLKELAQQLRDDCRLMAVKPLLH